MPLHPLGIGLVLARGNRTLPHTSEALASLDLVDDYALDTASQRTATGLDGGARQLILLALHDIRAEVGEPLMWLCKDRFGSLPDYYAAVEEVWGHHVRRSCEEAMLQAEMNAEFSSDVMLRQHPGFQALLLAMPEPDFRLAVGLTVQARHGDDGVAKRITSICKSRGAPWTFEASSGFEWIGDEIVERQLLRPALAVLEDPRLAAGAGVEFTAARNELRIGRPVALGQAVVESAKAVESAMKVLLDDRRIAYPSGDVAQRLFDLLVSEGVVERYMERTVLAPMVARNKVAAHGGGAVAHALEIHEAEAIVAASAGAITFLGKLLTPLPAEVRRSLLTRLVPR